MLRRSAVCLTFALALSVPSLAQMEHSGMTGYHRVACIKVSREKTKDYRAWVTSDLRKYAQAEVEAGTLSTWFLLESVEPQGKSAECDYLSIWMYPGAPPEPMSNEQVAAMLKKAGVADSAQQFLERRDSLTTLVSYNMLQNRALVGNIKTGDYLVVNYMKAADVDAWVAFEKKIWQPVAEAMVKDGVSDGWSLNVQVLPGGSDLKFQGVTVDIYPSWDAVFKDDPQFMERFKRAHPDLEFGTTFEQFEKLRTITAIQLFSVVDMVTPAK
ncbi:MAG TPA: hypothetical protein VLV49_00205 [Terriglobales bacterium]|nr:hypothetical protein [Terriglobales bacterium]